MAFFKDFRISARGIRGAVELILGGELSEAAWQQCSLGVSKGGRGLRTAREGALAAFRASRISARPHVNEMAGHLAGAGLCSKAVVMNAYDKRSEDAMVTLMASLTPEKGLELVEKLTQAAEDADALWLSLFDEDAQQLQADVGPRRGRPQRLGNAIIPLDDGEDQEHPDSYDPTPGECNAPSSPT